MISKKNISSVEKFIQSKIYLIGILLFAIIAWNIYKVWAKDQQNEVNSCQIEETLHFSGTITDYSPSLTKSSESFSFIVNDSIYIIPRSDKGLTLEVGDTIEKRRGEHLYYIKRGHLSEAITNRHFDTLKYICN